MKNEVEPECINCGKNTMVKVEGGYLCMHCGYSVIFGEEEWGQICTE